MKYDTIFFDIDGTLCDPGKSMIESARYALGQLGINETDDAKLNQLIGPPLEHAFKDYYNFDEERTDQAVQHFRDKMQSDGILLYEAYPGIAQLLEKLKSSDVKLAIVTSKIEHIAFEALETTGLKKYFEFVYTQQPNVVVEKAVILAKALNETNTVNKQSAVMIGDRKHDIEAANTNTIDSIGVLWGYGSRAELEDEGAPHIVADVSELEELLIN